MAVVQTLIGNVKGPAGATGATGAQGPQGDAATIAVGSVTSAAYGTPASVTNSGTSGAAVFDFVIPQGKPGEKTTKMGELVLDTITTSTDEFPSPAVDDTGAIAFGKIRKFFADTLSALAAKIDTNKIANNLTTNDPNYVLSAAQGKALNDSLESISTVIRTTGNSFTNGFQAGTYTYYKYGKLVYISGNTYRNSACTKNVTYAFIASSDLPYPMQYFMGGNYMSFSSTSNGSLVTDGYNICISPNNADLNMNTYIYFWGLYFTN